MDWMEYTVLTTREASDLISQILMDAGSAGTMIEDKNDVAANQRPEGQWDIIDEEIARRIYTRHRLLSEFLEHLGVSGENAAADACKMEHDISAETFEKLVAFGKSRGLITAEN